MKKCLSVFAVVLVSVFLNMTMAFAQQDIVIVDMQALMRESEAAKSIHKQANELRDAYRKTITNKEKELRSQEKDLLGKKANLSQDEFNSEREKFEKKLVSTQREVMGKQQEIDNAFTEAMDVLRGEAVQIIAKKAKEKNANLVLPRQNIIIVDQNLDITEEVLKELNGKIKTVKVKTK